MKYVKLLKYLENLNYVYLYLESAPANESRFGRLIQGSRFIAYSPYDPDIKNLIIKDSENKRKGKLIER